MSNSIEKLQAKKNELIARAQSTLGEKGPRSAEYKAALAAVDEVVSDLQSLEFISRNLPKDAPKPVQPVQVPTVITSEEVRANKRAHSNLAFKRYFQTHGFETRDLVTTSTGAFSIPQETHPVLQSIQKTFYPVLEQLTVINRESARPLQLAVEDSTALFLKAGAEAAAPSESDLTASGAILDFAITTATVKASRQLFDDSAFDLTDVITKSAGKQLSYTLDAGIFAGTDAGGNALSHQANLLANVTVGTTTPTLANGIGEQDLAALVESIPSVYWSGASFVMNAATYLTLVQAKDSAGRRLYKELGDNPPHLWQWPVLISNSLPSVGASTTPVQFGAFKNVFLALVGLSVKVLTERFADQNLLGYQLYSQFASTLLVPNSIRSLKIAAS